MTNPPSATAYRASASVDSASGSANSADASPASVSASSVADEAEQLAARFRRRQPHVKPVDLPPSLRELVREAELQLNTDLAWYRALNAADKNQLRMIIETAVTDFVDWLSQIDASAFADSLDVDAHDGDTNGSGTNNGNANNSRHGTDSGNADSNNADSANPSTASDTNHSTGTDTDHASPTSRKPLSSADIADKFLHPSTDHIFFVAPLEFTKSITLNQTVELTRFIVDVLERNVTRIAKPGREQDMRNAMLYYSREVAFSAATVYASSAQARGDWDARLEALTIADLLDGVTSHQVSSRMSLLGWSNEFHCFAMAGHMRIHAGDISLSMAHRQIREAVRSLGGECLIGEHETLMVALIDPRNSGEPEDYFQAVAEYFADDSPVSIGPVREGLDGAAYTLRAAVNSHRASRCLTDLPRPLRSDDVLPERALLGDADARRELYDNVYSVLRGDDTENPLLLTLSTFLRSGNSLDATARELNVHPNTVRYRLKRSVEVTGWDPMNPREAYVLLTAIKIGLMLDD